MSRKTVLVAGASGLVGYAAIRHFLGEGADVIAVSRRKPEGIDGARFIAADLTDEAACARIFGDMPDITHVVYAALYERPGLVAGWREAEQIAINYWMLRNRRVRCRSVRRACGTCRPAGHKSLWRACARDFEPGEVRAATRRATWPISTGPRRTICAICSGQRTGRGRCRPRRLLAIRSAAP